jgi:hypothetical protein
MKPHSELLALALLVLACAPNPPRPLVVLENPATGERVSFFREIPYKVPADYDEDEHLAQWKAEQERAGFTVEVKD